MASLTRFQITGLYGVRDIDISIKDNTKVFVGENGFGKTTLLKYMVGILSGNTNLLPPHQFKRIIVTINNTEYTCTYEDLQNSKHINVESWFKNLPTSVQHKMMQDSLSLDDLVDDYSIVQAYKELNDIKHALSMNSLVKDKSRINSAEASSLNTISRALNARIIYLPTYRRIEEDLQKVVKGRYSLSRGSSKKDISDMDDTRKTPSSYIELVDFGMYDVKEKIKKKCVELSTFSELRFKDLAYMNLGDVIEKKYLHSDNSSSHVTDYDINKFMLCLSRNTKKALSSSQIELLLNTILVPITGDTDNTRTQILTYYFKKLVELQLDLESKEQGILDFCNVCNNYFASSDKEVVYDLSSFKVEIIKKQGSRKKEIDMSDLSSGEKQIVSLFSHLYLSENSDFFVIIDEPELSLSVPWQRRFLGDILSSRLCVGLIAATHSPFIYDNNLLPYTHGLGEYIKGV